MKISRGALGLLLIFMISIPVVLGASGLISTRGSISIYKSGYNVRVTVKRRASLIAVRVRPSRSYKWTLSRYDSYQGRYLRVKSGIDALGGWRLYTSRGNLWIRASDSRIFYNLNPGKYKFQARWVSNCYYSGLRLSRSFSVP